MSQFRVLLQKELALSLLDRRFHVVFALCVVLSTISVSFGAKNYLARADEAASVRESSRREFIKTLETGALGSIFRTGYWWSRTSSPLSVFVFGQSGSQPRESQIRYREQPTLQSSQFAMDPIQAIYGVIDLSFIAQIVLSLCVLLFTHDALCGEKEAGTLRTVAANPVPRATIAVTKMLGATIAVFVPLAFAFLLSALVIVFIPDVDLTPDDWLKLLIILIAFGLYLAVFVSVGVLVSALVETRITAFIILLCIWTFWLLVVPNVGVRLAERLAPAPSLQEVEQEIRELHQQSELNARQEQKDYMIGLGTSLPELTPQQREEASARMSEISSQHEESYRSDRRGRTREHRNEIDRRNGIARSIAMLSPVGAITILTESLADTGVDDLRRAEDRLEIYMATVQTYLEKKLRNREDRGSFADLPVMQPIERDAGWRVLARNVVPLATLILMTVVGFGAAYVAIVRYDVR